MRVKLHFIAACTGLIPGSYPSQRPITQAEPTGSSGGDEGASQRQNELEEKWGNDVS